MRRYISTIKNKLVKEIADWEIQLLDSGGSTIHCNVTVSGGQGKNDDAVSMWWLLRDNSGQKQADEALWASEKRFRSVADTASDAIIIFNGSLHLLYWNETAKNMFRYPAGETMYKLLGSIVTDGFDEILDREIEKILVTGQSELIGKSIEAVGVRQDGNEFPIEFSLATWYAGQEIFFTIIVRDISDRKQAEQKLINFEKMALLGRLTAGIAHEINTPIAAVRASLVEAAALLSECQASIGDPSVSDDDWRDIFTEMENAVSLANRSASRAASFVKGIRSQTRNPDFHDDNSFDAKTVISDSVLMLNHLFRKGNCSYEIEAPEVEVSLYGSPERFSRIVINLLVNAIDASAGKGGGPITLSLEPAENVILMRVADRGAGIDPENIPKLFDPMFSTKPFGEGSGLGLTIVHQILTVHFDGSIEVESELGEGTEFRLFFPTRSEPERV